MKFPLQLSFILYVCSTGDYGLYPGGQADYNKDDNAIGRSFGLNNNNNQDYNNDEDDDENGNDDDQEDDVEEDNNQETEDEDKDNEDDGGNDEDKDDDEDNNNNFGGDYSGSFQPRGLNNEASSNLMRKFAKFNPQRTSYGGCTSLLL